MSRQLSLNDFLRARNQQRLRCILVVLCIIVTAVEARTRIWRVGRVRFEGNREFSRSELLSLMELRPQWPLYRIRFSESRLRSDIEDLEGYYRSRGYIHVAIEASSIDRDSSSRRVAINLAIDEGPRTIITETKIVPRRGLVDSSMLTPLESQPDEPLIQTVLDNDVRRLKDSIAQQGFLEAATSRRVEIDSAGSRAVVTFIVDEGPRIEVGDIRLKGLSGLRPRVVLRELKFNPGDTLTLANARRSERNLYNSGLFSFVTVEPVFTDTSETLPVRDLPDGEYPVLVRVDEADFLRLETGIGYGTYEQLRASLRVSYGNLWGLGHRITLAGKASFKAQESDLIYSTLWLYRIPLHVDGSVYFRRFDDPDLYRGLFEGFRLSAGRQLDYSLSYLAWLKIESVRYIIVPLGATGTGADSLSPNRDFPEKNTQSIGFTFNFDTRNDLFNPTRGKFNSIQLELAGLTGDNSNQFYRIINDFRLYWDMRNRLFFGSALRLGYISPYGLSRIDGVPIQEQFFGGGSRSVRGFKEGHLDTLTSGEARSGNVLATATLLDFRFPLFWWINGALFVDVGNVWQDFASIPRSASGIFSDLRWTAGPGLRINTPLAVVRLDLGFKLDWDRQNESLWSLHFDIGQPF